ncbi:tRNA glutamyl-Q(34) synthetase GluQRS [Novosphingobium colocasiae]|uniref:tRNA glutamyl-Q(34) synthetase GluQRS n=1 Tax=Novosphingobium colocasiae TaxID=1256513 RepID=UPI0035ADD8F2
MGRHSVRQSCPEHQVSGIVTRFAPSPNGPLHLGHAFAAIVAHDLARARGGRFLLRIEDIDGDRSRPEFAAQFLEDLTWLGLAWDGAPIAQSDRIAAHAAAADRLKAMGLLYPCRCTRAEIAAAARATGPDGPVYPGTCRGRAVDPEGAAWRLDVTAAMALTGPLAWQGETAGPQVARPELFGDVVLLRKDLPGSYHLAVTLDDAADAVTLVTRGADLFASTHVHRLLQALLALPVPVWHHHPLLVEPDGRKLAKRRGSPSLAERRLAGEDGRALAQALRDHCFPAGISLSQRLDCVP